MADCSSTPILSRIGRSRMAAIAASGALILSACTPAAQQATGTRPVTQMDDELASLMRVARITRQSGEYETAIALYRRAHEMVPQNPLPLVELAGMLGDIGNHAEAALVWQDALQVAPNDPAVQAGYGLTLARLGQPDLARPYLQKSVAAAPTSSAYNTLGVVLDQLGDAAGAQAAYRAGLELAPNDISLANNLGLSLALSGELDESLRILERIVVRPDATSRHRQNLALAYGLAGQDDLSAKFGRIDFDPAEAQRNVMRYASITQLPDHAARVSAVGALRGAQAANLKSAASVQSAALVKSRNDQTGTATRNATPAKSGAPVTPMLNATPLSSPKQTAEAARPASANPLSLSDPVATPTNVAPKAKPSARPSPIVASTAPVAPARSEKPATKSPVKTPAVEREASAQAPRNDVVAADSAKANSTVQVARKAPEPRSSTKEPVAPTKSAVAATVEPVDAAQVPVKSGTAVETSGKDDSGTVRRTSERTTETPSGVATADQPPVRVANLPTGKPAANAVTAAADTPALSKPAGQTPQAVPQSAAGNTAGGVSAAPQAVSEPEPMPAYGPALAGVEVPPIDDRLNVAASAYQAGSFEFAASIWQPLADAGVGRALFHLGALYYEGRGVERDLTRAYMLLRKAELAGFTDARIVLALVEAKLSDAERQTAESQLAASAR